MSKYVDVRLSHLNLRRISQKHSLEKVEKVTREVLVMAKIAARGPYSTGHLASTLDRTVTPKGGDTVGRVFSTSPKAQMIHDGTAAHPIHPIAPNGTLVFFWRKVGRTVYFKRPHIRMHPGAAPKPFLAEPARIVGRRNRFVVITY